MIPSFLVAIIVLAAHVQAQAQPASITYTVRDVYDGDTFTALDSSGNAVRIRVICIDAPERSQPTWGIASRDNLRKLLPVNSKLTVKNPKTDYYGRLMGFVYNSNGILVNTAQVANGYAVAYTREPGCESYLDLEKKAKQQKLNIWSDPNFVLPSDYKQQS